MERGGAYDTCHFITTVTEKDRSGVKTLALPSSR